MTGFADLSLMLGYIALAVLSGLVIADVQRDFRRLVSGRNVVLLSIIIWYLLEATLRPSHILEATQAEYDFGVFCVAMAALAFLITYHSRPFHWFDTFGRRLQVLDDRNWQWRLFVAGFLIGAAPILILGKFDLTLFLDGVFSFQKRWTARLERGRYGGWRDAFLELRMFHSAILPLATVILIRKDHRLGRRVVALVFLAWMALRALNSGTRAQIFTVGLPIAAGLYFQMSDQRKRVALAVGLPVLSAIALYWSAAVVMTRNSGEFSFDAAREADYVGFEMFQELLFITTNMDQRLEMQFGRTYFVQLVNPIPRFIWTDKPTGDAGILLARAYGAIDPETGDVTMTRSPGIIGEMYWNFGLIGILLLSAFGGVLVRAWDAMRERTPDSLVVFMVFSVGLAVLFLSGRSFSVPALYGLLSMYALMFLFGIGTGSRRAHSGAEQLPLNPGSGLSAGTALPMAQDRPLTGAGRRP